MDEFIKFLDQNYELIQYHIKEKTVVFNIQSCRKELECPFCVFFASTFWRKMQNIFGECCISKLEKVARPRLAAILPAT